MFPNVYCTNKIIAILRQIPETELTTLRSKLPTHIIPAFEFLDCLETINPNAAIDAGNFLWDADIIPASLLRGLFVHLTNLETERHELEFITKALELEGQGLLTAIYLDKGWIISFENETDRPMVMHLAETDDRLRDEFNEIIAGLDSTFTLWQLDTLRGGFISREWPTVKQPSARVLEAARVAYEKSKKKRELKRLIELLRQ